MSAAAPSPNAAQTARPVSDAVVYVFIVPLCIIVISIGFCCVYRRWEGLPIMGSDGTKKRVDPGLRASSPSRNDSGRLSGSSYKYVNSAPHR